MSEQKNKARENYNEAKQEYLKNQSNENWIKFCKAKRLCMLLGVII